MKTSFLSCAAGLIFAMLLGAPSIAVAQDPEAQVREQVAAFNLAYEQNELDSYFGYYTDDATLWLNAGWLPLADYKGDWYGMIAAGGGVQSNVLSDVRIQMGPDGTTAVATYQLDVETRMPDGSITIDHAHESDVWFKLDGRWQVAHVHFTVESPE